MVDRRQKDMEWSVADANGVVPSWERAQLAVLMDIRDELKRMNGIICCDNFIAVPRILRGIRVNTSRLRRVPVAKKKRRATR